MAKGTNRSVGLVRWGVGEVGCVLGGGGDGRVNEHSFYRPSTINAILVRSD